MSLTVGDIGVLCREVHKACAGGLVQKIWSGRANEVILRVRVPGSNHLVLLSAGDALARIHLVSGRTVAGGQPSAFVGLLRKHLLGARITEVRHLSDDRLAALEFKPPARAAGEEQPWGVRIIAELTGRHGNLFLVDENDQILGSLRANVSFRRLLAPHQRYTPPAPRPQSKAALSSGLPAIGASAVLAAAVERDLATKEATSVQTNAERTLRKALRKTAKKVDRIASDLKRASRADELQRRGQLLQSAYGKVPKGSTKADVPDYFDSKQRLVEIPLEPALSLEENIQRYFKNAKRLKGARKLIANRLEQAERALQRIQEGLEEIAGCEEPQTVVSALRKDGLLPTRQSQERTGKKTSERLPYHRFTSKAGHPILVGRSAKDNHVLTFRVARGNDLWLHVDGAGGAHVVVRLPKRTEVDNETLLDAATLAAFYSRRKNDTTVDVRYARQAEVRKPKGAPAGTVSVLRSRVIPIRMEDERIQRLMETRS